MRIPYVVEKEGDNNFIFNEIKVIEEASKPVDTHLVGAISKISIQKVKIVFVNEEKGNAERRVHTRLVAIKAAREKNDFEKHMAKTDH